LAPEKGISNIEVSCSTVGSRNESKNLGGSSGFTGGSGSGSIMSMGGFGFGVGLGVGLSCHVKQGYAVWSIDINPLKIRIVI